MGNGLEQYFSNWGSVSLMRLWALTSQNLRNIGLIIPSSLVLVRETNHRNLELDFLSLVLFYTAYWG